jgi:hypothetical protein
VTDYKKVGPALAQYTEPPPAPIRRALAVWLVIRLARMMRGGYELGVNDGPLVRLFHRVTGTQAGDAWCAAFTSFCLFVLGKACPVPPMAYCPHLAAWASKMGVLDTTPTPGALMLFWRYVDAEKRSRFAHVGLVISHNADGTVDTIEGNTDDDGGREGWVVAVKRRRIGEGDRFVNWQKLVPE